MSILLNNHGGDNQPWQQALSEYFPAMPVHVYPQIPDAHAIQYAVVWEHPHGDLLNYPNLKAILVLGAGMDHIDAEPCLPSVPVVRLVDPAVNDDMAQYALYWVMHFQRGYERYRRDAEHQQWRRYETPASSDFRVSVLGAGRIGSFISQRFAQNGFIAQNWSRTGVDIDGVQSFDGEQGLAELLANTDALINCLPLNAGTQHFLDKIRLRQLPKGAYLINVSRGGVVDDAALLELLDSQHIAAAALDTFVQEPLPPSSQYWRRDNVFITPHMAGGTYAKSAAKVIAENIQRVENGEQPFPIYHREAYL